MTRKEYSRLMKSISTIPIITVLTVISVISFIISLSQKKMCISQLNSPTESININALKEFIEDFNVFEFMYDFWFVSEFYLISIIAFLLFVGIFLSHQIQKQKETAYGNLLVSRIGYKKYLDSMLISQSLYIFSVVVISSFISIIIALILGGFGNSSQLGGFDLNLIQSLIIVLAQIMITAVIMVLINGCSLLFSTFIKNKYILQAFPLFMFFIIPQLIVSTLGNISDFIGKITLPFILQSELMAIDNILNEYINTDKFEISNIAFYLIPIISYFALFTVLYCINIKKNEREYI